MQVVKLVSWETGADTSEIMLLRHSNGRMERIEALGVPMAQYTSIQPPGAKWDFWAEGKPRINVVVVVARDRVHSVYRVNGIEAEENVSSMVDERFWRFYLSIGRQDCVHRRFHLKPLPSRAIGLPITGWRGKEINSPLRSNTNLFWEIECPLDVSPRMPDKLPMATAWSRLIRIGLAVGWKWFRRLHVVQNHGSTEQARWGPGTW